MPRTKKRDRTVTGVLSVTRRGTGYVAVENTEEDIVVELEDLNTALHGDVVEVRLYPKQRRERQLGEVMRVVSRAKTQFVGVLETSGADYLLKPDDERMYRDIRIPKRTLRGKRHRTRTKALVQLAQWSNPQKSPEGRVVRILGRAGVHETEMQAIVLARGFDTRFPKRAREEAQQLAHTAAITKEEARSRRDFRDTTTFTIDPHDAKDFDDALSVRTLPDGNTEVGIHIADVSHYMKPGSAIDKEAADRGTSIYLVDRTIPMLPEALSNDLCSLNPREDKRTYSAVFVLDADAQVHKRWFGETLIHSDKRFSYREAQEHLNDPKAPYHQELALLNRLASKLRRDRFKKGAIAFEQDEVGFRLDEQGKPLEVFKKERFNTHLLIEDCMLLANREVASHFYQLCRRSGLRDAVFVYRVHDIPDAEKIEELGIFLRAIGYEFETKREGVSGKDINRLFKHIEGTPEEQLIKTATIRSMAKAVYATKNIGHFGLAFRHYTHFTSPIRRYPDVMVHRILKSHLGGRKLSSHELVRYERLAIQSSQREIAAVEAERESVKYKQVEYMQGKVGHVFDGIIAGVVEWGLYVEESETKAEGLVHISHLKDDYYVYERSRYRLVGQETRRVYTLGDQVRIKLIGANLEDKTLEWKIV